MESAFGKGKIVSFVDFAFFSFITDDTFSVKDEKKCLAWSLMLVELCSLGHRDDSHLSVVIMEDVKVDDLSFLIGKKILESEHFSGFDFFIHECILLFKQKFQIYHP